MILTDFRRQDFEIYIENKRHVRLVNADGLLGVDYFVKNNKKKTVAVAKMIISDNHTTDTLPFSSMDYYGGTKWTTHYGDWKSYRQGTPDKLYYMVFLRAMGRSLYYKFPPVFESGGYTFELPLSEFKEI